MRRSQWFVAVLIGLCAAAILAVLAGELALSLSWDSVAGEAVWVAACAVTGLVVLRQRRWHGSETAQICGWVLVGTAAWQVVKWGVVLAEEGVKTTGLPANVLAIRLGLEIVIIALLLFVAMKQTRGATRGRA